MKNIVEVKSKKSELFFGVPVPVYIMMLVIVLGMIYTKTVPNTMTAGLAVLLILSAIIGEIGDRIPIWNTYIGGGAILCFLIGGILYTYGFVPEQTSDVVINFFDEFDYLGFYISILITGSMLSINRKLLIKSLAGYFPAIFGGLVGAAALGCVTGLLFGKPFGTILTMYFLPIMGGGTGAGALPMSEIYANITGGEASTFLSFALPILTIANILCIIMAAMLNRLGEVKPYLTGNGDLMRSVEDDVPEDTKKIEVTANDIAAGLMLAVTFFSIGRIFSKAILPKIGGVIIHQYAYMILFVAIANVLDIVPESIKLGGKKLQSFFTGKLLWMQMFAVGMALTDFNELLGALTISNVIIAAAIVIGGFLGSAVVGSFFGFFPIESGITAGLCMANRGGSGDVAVLGAAKRMSLIPYAQISSRIGGGFMLVLASIIFGIVK